MDYGRVVNDTIWIDPTMTTFVNDYVRDLRAAIVVRRQSTTPYTTVLVSIVNVLVIAYIAAAILFILSLGGLSQHETAKRGNQMQGRLHSQMGT